MHDWPVTDLKHAIENGVGWLRSALQCATEDDQCDWPALADLAGRIQAVLIEAEKLLPMPTELEAAAKEEWDRMGDYDSQYCPALPARRIPACVWTRLTVGLPFPLSGDRPMQITVTLTGPDLTDPAVWHALHALAAAAASAAPHGDAWEPPAPPAALPAPERPAPRPAAPAAGRNGSGTAAHAEPEDDEKPPKTGRELLGWAGHQDPDPKPRIIAYGKKAGFPGKIVDWTAEQVGQAYRAARNALSRQPSARR